MMSGFVGIYDKSGSDNSTNLKKMADLIVHRGPDDEGYYCNGNFSLGIRYLAITNLEGAALPISNEDDSIVIVCDGGIYNHKLLREELTSAGHVFKTKTDMEVLVHAYEEHGVEMLQKLCGTFSFVIYDKNKNKLFGARDIFGIKPFYYYQGDGIFMFGSEIKSFLAHPKFEKELREELIPTYMCFEYIPNHETMFKNVFKIKEGQFFECDESGIEIKEYNDVRFNIDNSKTIEYWKEQIEEKFKASCEINMESEIELGCFLSSGVDSSLVTNEMKNRFGSKLKSFSVGYEETKYSELDDARELSDKLGIENIQYRVSADEFFDAVHTVQYHLDEPMPNPSAVPILYLSRNTAKYVKMVLSGEGSDELFGGYNYYKECLAYQRYRRITPGFMRKTLAKAAKAMPKFHGRRFLMRGVDPIEKRYIRNNYVFDVGERDKYLAKPIPSLPPEAYTAEVFARVKDEDEITKMQYADTHTWMVHDIALKVDKMTMAASLAVGVPFLDKEVMNVAMKIPTKHRVNKKMTKLAVRAFARSVLPEKNANMRKLGFPVPLNDWLKQDKYYNIIKTAFNSVEAGKFFNKDEILKLLEDHRENKAANMKRIWSLYCFIVWYDEYFIKR